MRSSLRVAVACAALLLPACGDDDSAASTPGGRDGGGRDGGPAICTVGGDCEQAVTVGAPEHFQGDIAYDDPPPAGGPHNPCWAEFGVHAQAVRPENWVHNLEHGAVVYLYDCSDGCADDVAALSELVDPRPWALLTPYPELPRRFAAVAWGVRLLTDELDLDAFAAFYDAHADRGLESISSGPPSGCP